MEREQRGGRLPADVTLSVTPPPPPSSLSSATPSPFSLNSIPPYRFTPLPELSHARLLSPSLNIVYAMLLLLKTSLHLCQLLKSKLIIRSSPFWASWERVKLSHFKVARHQLPSILFDLVRRWRCYTRDRHLNWTTLCSPDWSCLMWFEVVDIEEGQCCGIIWLYQHFLNWGFKPKRGCGPVSDRSPHGRSTSQGGKWTQDPWHHAGTI